MAPAPRTSIAEVAAAVDTLVLAAEADQLEAALAVHDRLAARISAAIADYDAAGGWDPDGATSMTAWLRQRGRCTNADAHRWARTARRLRALPVTRHAWETGNLSGGQTQAILANLGERTVERFAGHEPTLVPLLAPLAVRDVATAMHTWAARADALDDPSAPHHPHRELHLSQTLGGRYELRASLEGETGAVVAAALRRAQTDDVDGEPPRPPAERRADALTDICRRFLDEHPNPPGHRNRPHINVVIDLDTLTSGGPGRTDDDTWIDPITMARLVCDASLSRVILRGPSAVLDHGQAVRTATPAQFNALVIRDRRCRFGDCDRRPAWCQAHHIIAFTHGGPTDLDNLVLGCTRHHHIWHRPGWSLKRLPDGTVETHTPHGQTLTSPPPPPPPPARPPP